MKLRPIPRLADELVESAILAAGNRNLLEVSLLMWHLEFKFKTTGLRYSALTGLGAQITVRFVIRHLEGLRLRLFRRNLKFFILSFQLANLLRSRAFTT